MKRFRAALAAAALMIGGPVAAQDDDITSRIINAPTPGSFKVHGLKAAPKPRTDATVQGGKALRVNVPGADPKPYAVSLADPIVKPVKAGDKLVLAFWARLEKSDTGAATARIAGAQVQLATEPYTVVFGQGVDVGPEWKMHEIQGTADKDYAADTLNVSMHLSTGKHTLDLGPIFLLNMGQ